MKIKPLEALAYVVLLGWFLLLGKYLVTDVLDNALFITVSGALGTISGLIAAGRNDTKRLDESEEKEGKKDV